LPGAHTYAPSAPEEILVIGDTCECPPKTALSSLLPAMVFLRLGCCTRRWHRQQSGCSIAPACLTQRTAAKFSIDTADGHVRKVGRCNEWATPSARPAGNLYGKAYAGNSPGEINPSVQETVSRLPRFLKCTGWYGAGIRRMAIRKTSAADERCGTLCQPASGDRLMPRMAWPRASPTVPPCGRPPGRYGVAR